MAESKWADAGVNTLGNIPVLTVSENSLAKAWETSLLVLWKHGCRVKTQYDQDDDTPPSIDSTMVIEVKQPLSEPRIHRCFPGGIEDLQEYVMELVEGVKDHWVRDPNDPDDKRWSYTYHERLTKYPVLGKDKVFRDQLEVMIDQLARAPHTRRANVITWKVWEDPTVDDPPCLQSIWTRMLRDDASDVWRLNMNVRFRSRDAFKAAFMNMFGMVTLQNWLASRVSEAMKAYVIPGRYCEINDSYHIYGFDLDAFHDTFLDTISGPENKRREWEDRVWNSTDPMVQDIMREARADVLKKIEKQDANRT